MDWYAWGEEALARARAEDRPLLVSIGYSACHWCHVMEHESFEDPKIAGVMNERFVCVKVDREERPDIDAVCMDACQALTGHGGWPLNAFLTPALTPFFAGTYFPPQPRGGMPSWRMVLDAVSEAWRDRREEVERQGGQLAAALARSGRLAPSAEPIRDALLDNAVAALAATYDRTHGGFGGAPKFPQASVLEFLLARGEREMAPGTLAAMAAGGIYDQVGGGFARYAVDGAWTVPHFEKMLYDNALLARVYLHGWQVTRQPRFRRVCCETLDWVLGEMRGPEGGFYSALDADSEGVEGRFYVWTVDELRHELGPLADEAIAYFGATELGNFEHGANVLQAKGAEPERLTEIRALLQAARAKRVRPGLDDKRLTAWNSLMIASLAEAGGALERSDYVEAAVAGTEFVVSALRAPDGGLLRTWKEGPGTIGAYLEDYAFLLDALITVYETTFEERFYLEAVRIAGEMIKRFADPDQGGFFTTAAELKPLVSRRKDMQDSPVPSGNSAAALSLLRLALLSGEGKYERYGLGVLRVLFGLAVRQPNAFGHLLQAADFYLAPVREVAIVGAAPDALIRVVRSEYRPHVVLAAGSAGAVPLLEGREPVDGAAAAYVCEHFACQAPVTTPDALAAAL